jgi:epsilon-lactone hydrolase
MQRSTTAIGSTDFVVTHALDPEDASTVAAMRAMASATKGTLRGVAARGPFDALMESVSPKDGVTFKSDAVGGIPGLWVHPPHCHLTRPSSIYTAAGSTWEQPTHTAILSRT